MSDYSELKRLAQRVIDIEALDGGEPIGEAWGEFEAAATPAAVLALIAEVEALFSQVATLQSAANSWQSGYDEGRRIGTKTAMDERESLRKDAERYRYWRSHTESFFLKRGENLDLAERNDRFIDAAMTKGERQ